MHTVFIGIGSNLGSRQAFILQAIQALQGLHGSQFKACSEWYINPPVGLKHQGAYINGVVLVKTALHPVKLLRQLKAIERNIGRKQKRKRWGPRVIDLDILLFDTLHLKRQRLQLPHPQVWRRDFTVIPLLDLYDKLPPQWQNKITHAAQHLPRSALERTPMPGLKHYRSKTQARNTFRPVT